MHGGYGIYRRWVTGIPITVNDDSDGHDKSREPIDLVTGDFTYSHTDLDIGSAPYPFGLQLVRSYNSGSRLVDGPLGLGWSHSFNLGASESSDGFQGLGADSPIDAAAAIAEIYVATDILKGTTAKERLVISSLANRWFMDQLITNVVSVSQPGNSQQHVKLPDGSYNPPPGVASCLTKNPGGSLSLRTKTGETASFDATGKLTQWADRNSNTVSFTYSGGRLQSVTNGLGRSLTFTYTGSHLTQLSDSAGRTVSYGYDTNNNLVSVTNAAGQPNQVHLRFTRPAAERFLPGRTHQAERRSTPMMRWAG